MNEYLSNDILDEDFLSVFSSYRFLQILLGSCRVDARQRFVTPPRTGQRLYTVTIAILNTVFAVLAISRYVERFSNYPNLYKTWLVTLTVHLICYLSNLIHVRFLNNQLSIQLYVDMQKVDRAMKIDKIKCLNQKYRRANNGLLFSLIVLLVVVMSVTFGAEVTLMLAFCGFTITQIPFVLEMAVCTNLLLFFSLRTQYLNAIIANHINRNISYAKIDMTSAYMKQVARQTNDFDSCDVDVYLRKIFTCFTLFQKNYAFQIFLLFFVNIPYIFLGIQFLIQYRDHNLLLTPREWILFSALQVFSLSQWLLMTFRCEAFYREVRVTKQLAITIMSIHFDGPQRKKGKKMLNMIKEKSPRFSVYGIWSIDASLLFKFLNILTMSMVNVLQLIDVQKSELQPSYLFINSTSFL